MVDGKWKRNRLHMDAKQGVHFGSTWSDVLYFYTQIQTGVGTKCDAVLWGVRVEMGGGGVIGRA